MYLCAYVCMIRVYFFLFDFEKGGKLCSQGDTLYFTQGEFNYSKTYIFFPFTTSRERRVVIIKNGEMRIHVLVGNKDLASEVLMTTTHEK